MATLYTQQSKNVSRTWLLMAGFLVVIGALGYFASYYYNSPDILYFALIFSVVMNIWGYWFSDKVALSVAGAHPIEREQYPELFRIVENLAITAGLPMPRLYLIDDPSPNAFATGRNKNHAAIAVTSGLVKIMNKTELEGVLAHEMSHIGNRDILLSSVVVVLVGLISIFSNIFIRSSMFGGFGGRRGGDRENNNGGGIIAILGIVFIILSPILGTIIQLAISRKREYLADATGALITRYPEGLASALEKIEAYDSPMRKASNATAHLYISNPFGIQALSGVHKLFLTHPPIEERIKILRGMN